MPHTWIQALNSYLYPVKLSDYERAQEFPEFFVLHINGDRGSTIAFENHFIETAPHNIEAFFEVVFWKLYSQSGRRQNGTNRIVDFVQQNGITSQQLWDAVRNFIEVQNIANLIHIRCLLGLKSDVLAVPLTLPAFVNSQLFPMIDNQVAKWVNHNIATHNHNRINQLTLFTMNYTSLRDNDFHNYLNWIAWCREMAQVLTELTGDEWRSRDIEMAVFTAQRTNMNLNVLPQL